MGILTVEKPRLEFRCWLCHTQPIRGVVILQTLPKIPAAVEPRKKICDLLNHTIVNMQPPSYNKIDRNIIRITLLNYLHLKCKDIHMLKLFLISLIKLILFHEVIKTFKNVYFFSLNYTSDSNLTRH
ncbi:UNVERIFIED_CONTAM: hypothetical protein NCL1_44511 [Trichonephila clavipes]